MRKAWEPGRHGLTACGFGAMAIHRLGPAAVPGGGPLRLPPSCQTRPSTWPHPHTPTCLIQEPNPSQGKSFLNSSSLPVPSPEVALPGCPGWTSGPKTSTQTDSDSRLLSVCLSVHLCSPSSSLPLVLSSDGANIGDGRNGQGAGAPCVLFMGLGTKYVLRKYCLHGIQMNWCKAESREIERG